MTFSIPKRIEAWFSLSPHVSLDLNQVGNRNSEGGLVIGGRASASMPIEYSTVSHEMAHMIEIDDARVCKHNWGLTYGKWHTYPTPNRYSSGYFEMTTDQAIQREVRVVAIQAAVTEHCGLVFDYVSWAEILGNGAIQNHSLWKKRLGLSFDDEVSSCRAVEAGVIRSMRENLSIEPLWHEWVRKTAIIGVTNS